MGLLDTYGKISSDRLDALEKASSLLPDTLREQYQSPQFQLMLKKKRIESFLMQALRDQGDEDLAKIARFRRIRNTEGGI